MKSNWQIDKDSLESIVIGAGILGTGGGGNPYVGKLSARKLLREGHRIEVIALEDVPDHWNLCVSGAMGAPTIGMEKLTRGTETTEAVRLLEEHVGHRIDAVMPVEIGGTNSIEPMTVAARLGIPVVDADGMGRAFPALPMNTFHIYGISPFPFAMADEKGNAVVLPKVVDDYWLERLARATTVQMGGLAGCAAAHMSGADAKRTAIDGTLSWARRLGERVRRARAARDEDVLDGILEVTGGRTLFQGKIIDVERRNLGGFARGQLLLEGSDEDAGAQMKISFQNEYLIAWRDGKVVATVPDLICMVNREDGEPLTVEQLRYGFRVTIIGVPCSELLRTPAALKIVGPPAFGYDLPFEPMERIR